MKHDFITLLKLLTIEITILLNFNNIIYDIIVIISISEISIY